MGVLETVVGILDLQTVLIALTSLLLVTWLLDLKNTRDMPPGPFQWPIVGCMPQVTMHGGHKFLDYLSKLGQKYAKIGMFQMKLGEIRAVFICDFQVLKEAFVKQGDCTSARPELYSARHFLNNHDRAIILSDGPKWQTLRRFTISSMRDMGVGKKSLEEKIQIETAALRDEFAKNVDKLYDPSVMTQKAVANIIAHLIFGERYDYTSSTLDTVSNNMRTLTSIMSPLNLKDMFKILQPLPDGSERHRMDESRKLILDIVKKQIQAHQDTYHPEEVRDVIDKFIAMKSEGDEQSKYFTDVTLTELIYELFFAGAETTATTLAWSWLYMAEHPEVQEKCKAEIDQVIGGRVPGMADRAKLPYTDATICEVQRMSNITPMGIIHKATSDMTLNGYRIPKDTWLVPMLYHIHSDPRVNPDPMDFKPERFLDDNGMCNRAETLIPFSIGPRICAGESLARMELFIFFTCMIQQFKFSGPMPPKKIDIEPVFGFTLSPKPQEIIISAH